MLFNNGWVNWPAIRLCKKIGMEMAFVANKEDLENILFYLQYNRSTSSEFWIQSLLHKHGDSWVNKFTNETCPLEWSHIDGQEEARMVYNEDLNKLQIESQMSDH